MKSRLKKDPGKNLIEAYLDNNGENKDASDYKKERETPTGYPKKQLRPQGVENSFIPSLNSKLP